MKILSWNIGIVWEDGTEEFIGDVPGLHGVNVKSIKMYTNFSPEIVLREDEAMKLYKKLRTLAPRLNAGLRNQMVKQMVMVLNIYTWRELI